MAVGTAVSFIATSTGILVCTGGSVMTWVGGSATSGAFATIGDDATCECVIKDWSRMLIIARGVLSTGNSTLHIRMASSAGTFIGSHVAQKVITLTGSESTYIIGGLSASHHGHAGGLISIWCSNGAVIGVIELPKYSS